MRLITFQQPYQTSTSAEAKLGEEAITPDGRAWKYVQVTSTTSAGAILAPDPNAVHQGTLAAGTLVSSFAGITDTASTPGFVSTICFHSLTLSHLPSQAPGCPQVSF